MGNEIITTYEIESRIQSMVAQGLIDNSEANRQDVVREIREDLIDEKILQIALSDRGLRVTDQEVERRIHEIINRQGISSVDEFDQILTSQGFSLNRIRQDIRRQLEMERFTSVLEQEGQLNRSDPTEEELRNYFTQNRDEFSSNIRLSVQECLLVYQEDRTTVEALVNRFTRNPTQFNECVQNYSQSPSAQFGGILRGLEKHSVIPQLQTALFSDHSQEVVSIEEPGMVRLFRILEREDLGPQSFEAVQELIAQRLRAERFQRAFENGIQRARSNLDITVSLGSGS